MPEISDDWIAEADLFQGEKLVRRGRPRVAAPRQLLSLRLPPNVIARWKASGPGWQTRMAQVLENSAPAATPPSD
ncbi:BrnA antitoxin family protein [Denitratimonas sp. CY0512]|uniref:BrnA antitoxin family protein n=1 Tax=Denitratimonas sp. CY0512 TaxID=3131940 RepID=UPI00309BA868